MSMSERFFKIIKFLHIKVFIVLRFYLALVFAPYRNHAIKCFEFINCFIFITIRLFFRFLSRNLLPPFFTYLYFLIYELLSPFIEIFGVFTMVLAWWFDLINVPFMLLFFLIYAVFGSVLTLTAFFSRIYTADLTLSFGDGLKAVCLCLFELVFLRFILAWVRCTAFIGYRKKKLSWGRIERRKIDLK